MGLFSTFFGKTVKQQPADGLAPSSFCGITPEQLETHMAVARYGHFTLSAAVRPAYDLRIVPRQGFRRDAYQEEGLDVPILYAAASAEVLFGIFMDLLDHLGAEVDVVLDSSHGMTSGHRDHVRWGIDLAVLKSILWDFEDLLVNDGCTGIAVFNGELRQEVQLEEHKLILVYGDHPSLGKYESVLLASGVPRDQRIKFISEAEHVHASSDEYLRQLRELQTQLGCERYR